MTAIDALLARWEADAATLRQHGAPAQADALEGHARQVREALLQYKLETLTVHQAAEESGYSAAHVRRLFQGREIKRGDLPRRPTLRAG